MMKRAIDKLEAKNATDQQLADLSIRAGILHRTTAFVGVKSVPKSPPESSKDNDSPARVTSEIEIGVRDVGVASFNQKWLEKYNQVQEEYKERRKKGEEKRVEDKRRDENNERAGRQCDGTGSVAGHMGTHRFTSLSKDPYFYNPIPLDPQIERSVVIKIIEQGD